MTKKKIRLPIYSMIGILVISIICIPLIQPGYIFAIDQAFSPSMWELKIGNNLFFLGILNYFLGPHSTEYIEKIIIVGSIFTAYFGASLFSRNQSNIFLISMGIFLVFNPFFYSRMVDGQTNIYMSYSFWIILVGTLNIFFLEDKISKKYIFTIVVITFIGGLISAHNIFISGFLYGIFLLVHMRKYSIKKLHTYLLVGLLMLGVNSYIILPTILGNKEIFDLLQQISIYNKDTLNIFQSHIGSSSNIYIQHLSLQGYWGEGQGRFVLSHGNNSKWFNIFFVMLVIICYGLYNCKKDTKSISFIIIGFLCYVLSLGVGNNNIFSGINHFMYDYIPYYKGFREPHKWLGITCIIMGYYYAHGIQAIYNNRKLNILPNNIKRLTVGVLIFFPIFYVPSFIWGLNLQLIPKEYPIEWYEGKTYLDNNTSNKICENKLMGKTQSCYRTLILPWHNYIKISWTGKVTGIWITKFFGSKMLFGDNIELGNIYSQSTRYESKVIESYFHPNKKYRSNQIPFGIDFLDDISKIGIQNILILKESDYHLYIDLFDQLLQENKLNIVIDNDYIRIYEIITPGKPSY